MLYGDDPTENIFASNQACQSEFLQLFVIRFFRKFHVGINVIDEPLKWLAAELSPQFPLLANIAIIPAIEFGFLVVKFLVIVQPDGS